MLSGRSKKMKSSNNYGLFNKVSDYLDSFSFFKTVLQEINMIMVFAILFIFNHSNLYFRDLKLSLSRPSSFVLCIVTVAVINVLVEVNPFFLDKKKGLFVETFLTIEFLFFYLFAQYHFWISVVLLVLSLVGFFWLYRALLSINKKEEKMNKKLRSWCWYRSSSLIACVMCVVLAVPAFVGYYEEFEKSSLSDEEWNEFLEWFDRELPVQTDSDLQQPTDEDKLVGLLNWDKISYVQKERTIRTVAMIEKDYLGINDDVEITVYFEKMSDATCGYYVDDTKEIFINYQYLNEGKLEDIIRTILHEMHHAFVYDTINTLDFESEHIQQSYFFKRAREWKENCSNYIDALQDFDAYQAQPIEADARAYAEERVLFYLDYISYNKEA